MKRWWPWKRNRTGRRPSPGQLAIRPATQADLPEIARIQIASPEAARWKPDSYLAYDCLVATLYGRMAGFVVARQTTPGETEILNLAVAPEARRVGVGTALMHEAMERPEFKSAVDGLKQQKKSIYYEPPMTEQAPLAAASNFTFVPAASSAAVNAALRRAKNAERELERLQQENARLRKRAKKPEPPPLTEAQQPGSIESMHERRIRLGPGPDDEAKGVAT